MTWSASQAERDKTEHRNPRMSRSTLRRVAHALTGPILAAVAVGVHVQVNVPKHPVQARHSKPARGWINRTPKSMDAAWARWNKQPFEGEPIQGKWARMQRPIISSAVAKAKKTAHPEKRAAHVATRKIECRTIRCRVVLSSRSPDALEPVAEALQRQRSVDGLPMWREVTWTPAESTTLAVTLGVQADGAKVP